MRPALVAVCLAIALACPASPAIAAGPSRQSRPLSATVSTPSRELRQDAALPPAIVFKSPDSAPSPLYDWHLRVADSPVGDSLLTGETGLSFPGSTPLFPSLSSPASRPSPWRDGWSLKWVKEDTDIYSGPVANDSQRLRLQPSLHEAKLAIRIPLTTTGGLDLQHAEIPKEFLLTSTPPRR